jgi:hypothetical protein
MLNLVALSDVKFEIYDMSGRLLSKSERSKYSGNLYSYKIDKSLIAEGIYICKIDVGSQIIYKKFNINK